MRGWLLVTAAVMATAGVAPASAADLGMPMKAPPIAAPVPVYNWTGFYIGGNVGGGWTHDSFTVVDSNGSGGTGSEDGNGWFGGGQIGFNFQFARNWVIGIEADADWADVKGSTSHCNTFAGGALAGFTSGCSDASTKQDDFGTVRGRLGYAINNVLLYGTGGWAWSRSTTTSTITCALSGCPGGPVGLAAPGFIGSTASTTATPSGWVAGGGIEWGFVPNWTLRVEYLHLQFDGIGQDFTFTSTTGATVSSHSLANTSEDTVRVGVNYLFNWGAPPVVARY
jgi:outer membrane immunogenic protein